MKNCELIAEKNASQRISISMENANIIIKCNKRNLITGEDIAKILVAMKKSIEQYPKVNFNFVIDIGNANFYDKLTYIILECIVYWFISVTGKRVQIKQKSFNHSIKTGGFEFSPLTTLRKQNNVNFESRERFYLENFKKFDIRGYHYRKIISSTEKKDTKAFSIILQEVKAFLMAFTCNKKYVVEVAEVVSELSGNAFEHGQSDCLIDIDVQDNYSKTGIINKKYCGVNITIVNFSNILLGDRLHQKMNSLEWVNIPKYKMLDVARRNHEIMFDETYDRTDFYNICSFQDKISGRLDSSMTGGTGFTKLIYSLERMADDHFCYVLSGDRVIYFLPDYLSYNDEKWIGFNKEKNFIDMRPSEDVVQKVTTNFFMPGTAFNLCFVIEK